MNALENVLGKAWNSAFVPLSLQARKETTFEELVETDDTNFHLIQLSILRFAASTYLASDANELIRLFGTTWLIFNFIDGALLAYKDLSLFSDEEKVMNQELDRIWSSFDKR